MQYQPWPPHLASQRIVAKEQWRQLPLVVVVVVVVIEGSSHLRQADQTGMSAGWIVSLSVGVMWLDK